MLNITCCVYVVKLLNAKTLVLSYVSDINMGIDPQKSRVIP